MADIKSVEGMIDSTPIMKDYADIESSKLPEYQIDSKIPEGPIADKWTNYKAHQKLVNPANKRNLDVIVVGTGLAGASAASTLAELGFNVYNFCIQDSPRRAHSIAAQGGINAAKDYQNDGDSVYRLFYDTVKGGDFRSREANVYRLAEVSNNIIDQCVQQGVPFAREYGGLLANRSFGGAQVSRTFYAKGQTGQQLLLGAYASLNRQIEKGQVRSFNRREMLDVVIIDGRARGIIVRNLVTGELERYAAHAVVLATGGYGRTFFLSTNAMGCNGSAAIQAFRKGAYLSNLERRYPAFGNLCPRDIASRAAKERCDAGFGVGTGNAVYLDFKYAIERLGADVVRDRYGNLFDMYQMISDDNPYETPMMIFPASHYTMGGIWVDYELQTSVKGLFAIGECNFSDHGANRLGASALMQGLADGYFVLPYTLQNYLSDQIKVSRSTFDTKHPEFDEAEKGVRDRIARLMAIKGTKSPDQIHKRLGHIMWDLVGMGRTLQSLVKAIEELKEVRKEFYTDLRIVGSADDLNTELEKALRLEDFLVMARMMAIDALHRNESCGAHFREEYQTADGEAKRDDEHYMYVSCWKYTGDDEKPILLKEPLKYEAIQVQTRNYKS